MSLSDAEYAAREAAERAYTRQVFDAKQGKLNRDVQRKRVAAIEAQTVEMAELRKALERLLGVLADSAAVVGGGRQ